MLKTDKGTALTKTIIIFLFIFITSLFLTLFTYDKSYAISPGGFINNTLEGNSGFNMNPNDDYQDEKGIKYTFIDSGVDAGNIKATGSIFGPNGVIFKRNSGVGAFNEGKEATFTAYVEPSLMVKNKFKTKVDIKTMSYTNTTLIPPAEVKRYVISVPDEQYVLPEDKSASDTSVSSVRSSLGLTGNTPKTVIINNLAADIVPSPSESKSTCNIKSIGWIICPIVNFLADITDKAYTFIQSNFLIIDNSLLEKNTVKAAWSSVQGIANIAFIIAFLVIIFSQVTSFGITNYGIKKMLPRLVIAAILVNISFIICKLGVDLSNTIGSSISNFFSNTIPKANLAPSGMPSSTGEGFAGIAGIVLVGTGVGAAMLLSLSALIPVLLAGIVACVMILFILVGRKALIVMLAVLSPLAFVAYMLPNTKKLFDWWKKGFTSMLLVYPIVALVFAGSKLASYILMPDSTTGDDTGTLNQIVASAVAIIPLFVVPGLLKKSLDGVAGIGNMVGKISTGASGLGKKAGAGGVNKYKGSDYGKFRATRKADIKSRVNTGNYEGSKRNFIRNAKSKAHRSINDSELFGKATGGRGADLNATAVKQDLADRKEFTESMGGNEELYSAVASGGFNEESDAFKNLTTENQTKIQKMKSRNLHRSASTYLATADYMTTNGLDDGDISHRAIQEAGKHNADQGTMIAAYKAAEDGNKKSGNFVALRKTLNHGTKYHAGIDDNFKKGPDNKEYTYKDAILKIAPRDLSHHSFKGADSANAKQEYDDLLKTNDNYAAASINQFSDMKAGTQEAVGEGVTAAGQRLADKRAIGAGYTDTTKVVPRFQNPQQAKTHLQNNIAPPPEIAPPSTPEVTTAPATSTEKFVPLRNRDGSILGEDMQSRDTKKSPGGIDL